MRSLRTTTKSSPHSPQLEKAGAQQQRPTEIYTLSLHDALPICGEWGLLFIAVSGLLIAMASLVVEHGL